MPRPEGRGPGGGQRRRRRAGRGDVRAALLGLLAERPMHGYEMIQELERRSGGAWSPSPGSVYPTLQLLSDEGLVTSEDREGRRLFALTSDGRSQAEEIRASSTPWEGAEDLAGPASGLRDAMLGLREAVRQVMHVASAEQMGQAAAVLVDARRRLYAVLAGETPSDR